MSFRGMVRVLALSLTFAPTAVLANTTAAHALEADNGLLFLMGIFLVGSAMIGRKVLLRPASKENSEPQPAPLVRNNLSPVGQRSSD
jgi:hypothetical protein